MHAHDNRLSSMGRTFFGKQFEDLRKGPETARTASGSFFGGKAVLMMELPRRYSTPSEGGRFAPIKSSNYGGRPLTGPRPDDLSELRLVEWSGWVNE